MPIKLPKGFVRRKSSGNALEELHNAPEPSFKVFERSGAAGRSLDGSVVLKRIYNTQSPATTPVRGYDDDNEELFPIEKVEPSNRGSGGTDKSTSTGAPYGSAASSARLSSSSTIPSSTDTAPETNKNIPDLRPHDTPIASSQARSMVSSLRSAGRNLSFASKPAHHNVTAPSTHLVATQNQSSPLANGGRERALTASTASTATPPKLLGTDLTFGDSEGDGFDNIFDGIDIGLGDSREISPSPGVPKLDPASSPVTTTHVDLPRPQRAFVASPIDTRGWTGIESSPYSQASHDSKDGLMASASPLNTHDNGNMPSPIQRRAPALQRMPMSKTSPSRRSYEENGESTYRKRTAHPLPQSPFPTDDEDARLLAESMSPPQNARREGKNPPTTDQDIADGEELSFPRSDRALELEARAAGARVPKSVSPPRTFGSTIDPSLAASAKLAAQWQERLPVPSIPAHKVMTPAQFERYRKEQELSGMRSDASPERDYDDASDDYDDDDEAERDREAVKQRRKQEAHLAVYRQTMMKVTGDLGKPPVSSLNGGATRTASLSTPDLTRRGSYLTADSRTLHVSGKSSGDEEEDEDVPLGILAAHGFPTKNRPPTRLTSSPSNTNLRVVSQSPGSITGDTSRHETSRNLPPFARHLPQDPYYGASLVNPSNRESFAMGGGVSSYGAPPPGPPPGLHPAGLVGVIAGEERARAMRRGSPNAHGGYDTSGMPPQYPGVPRSQTMGNVPTMGFPGMVPGMPPALSPGDQAQMQISQQMTQMMQMQMQWMQQMMQMQGSPQGQQGSPMHPQIPQQSSIMQPNMLAFGSQIQRPLSMPIPSSPRGQNRTMSTLTPNMAPWGKPPSAVPSIFGGGRAQGYAPSIAPSERSNVGLASRYRPVSIAPDTVRGPPDRSSTSTSSIFQPWTSTDAGRRSPGTPTINEIPPCVKSPEKAPNDEDDDQGWTEMAKKRDMKKSSWKLKKGKTALPLRDLHQGDS